MWTLFLDDEREFRITYPDYQGKVIPARSTEQAKLLVESYGCPEMLLLDHDLGGDDTSLHFLRWLAEWVRDDKKASVIVENLDYRIHSANPIGKENIKSFMESWKKSFQE